MEAKTTGVHPSPGAGMGNAIVTASCDPSEPREFVTTVGLTQPGAEIALKVYVVLSTGNESGSAVMLVERPASVELLAA